MNPDEWLYPVTPENPCGPSLDYDPEFLHLQDISRPQPGQQFQRSDGELIGAEGNDVDWKSVRSLAESLLLRSKDLRIAVLLTRALLRTQGYEGIRLGLNLIERLLTDYWDGVHPNLDEEDDNDPTMRLNALVSLNATDEVIADLRACRIIDSRQHGQITVRDIETSFQRLPNSEGAYAISLEQLTSIAQAVVSKDPDLGARIQEPCDTLRTICSQLDERINAAQLPDLSQLQGILDTVCKVFRLSEVNSPLEAEQNDLDATEQGGQTSDFSQPRESTAGPKLGQISNRSDVVTTLQKICTWLDQNEPTNPVQLVLRRAQRMMEMNFLQLMMELAPEALEQAEKIVGEKLHRYD